MPIRDENGWELVQYDHATGVSRWHMFDGERHHWRTDTPVDNVIEANRAIAAEQRGRRHGDGIGPMIANIPAAVYFQQVLPAVQAQDKAYLRKWLSENSAFSAYEGRI